MDRIAARDSSALAALYDRHASSLLALCVRVLRDRMEAEEVLGDVFWEVWERHDRYSAARGAPVAYLLTLTRSRAVDRLRSRRLRNSRTVGLEDSTGAEAAASLNADRAMDPLSDTLLAEQRGRVIQALGSLSGAQRKAVELSFFDGLSHSEIAQDLGEPLGTVKTRIRQGLLQLRKSLVDLNDARG